MEGDGFSCSCCCYTPNQLFSCCCCWCKKKKKKKTYLEDSKRLPVCDAFEAFAVNGEDSVAFLYASVPVGHTPDDHLMNLRININQQAEKVIDVLLVVVDERRDV